MHWLNEIELILMGLKDKGLSVLPLSDIIGKPVMIAAGAGSKGMQSPSELFKMPRLLSNSLVLFYVGI